MNQTLTTTTDNRKDIRTTLDGMKSQFAMALPRFLTVERFIRVGLTCINKNPKLLQCTRDSLLACLLDCAQLGIEPDGRRAHLIPYGDKCTLIIDYKGLAELVRRSGEISTLHAGIVYPGDEFDYAFGTGQYLKHKPALNREDSKPIAVYSYVKLKDGQEDFDVMGIPEVEKVRQRSRAGNNGPWITDFDEMAKKTVFRRHSKWLPLSPELRDKIEKDDEPLTEQERFAAARPITASEGISFGPSGVTADNEPFHTGTTASPRPDDFQSAPEVTEQVKRKRRTKAEMEAARASEVSNAGKPETNVMPAPSTPIQGLRNLIAASPFDEAKFTHHLISGMELEPSQTLDDLNDEAVLRLTNIFTVISGEILDAPKPEKGPF